VNYILVKDYNVTPDQRVTYSDLKLKSCSSSGSSSRFRSMFLVLLLLLSKNIKVALEKLLKQY